MSGLPKFKIILSTVVLIFLLVGCKTEPDKSIEAKINISVTVLPYKDFVENVGGDKVNVNVLIPPGVSPHDFELTPKQIRKIYKSDLYFKVGEVFIFEKVWLDKIISTSKKIKIIDCSQGIQTIGNNHHLWLGMKEAKIIVNSIYEGLAELSPANKEYFFNNKVAYLNKLDSAETIIDNLLIGNSGKSIFVFHPAFVYFLDKYGIKEIAIEKDGKHPHAFELSHLIESAKQVGAKTIFVQPQFDTTSALTIAEEIGAELIYIDSLPKNYISNQIEVAKKIGEQFN